jgi:hypothetical protein
MRFKQSASSRARFSALVERCQRSPACWLKSKTAKARSQAQGDKPFTLHLLLSPGTPTMAAIFVLLGKTKYPATFWQTWDSKATQTEIPLDLIMDVVPDLLRGPDNRLSMR